MIALLAIAAAGFAPTFYRRPAELPALPLVVLTHGLLGTAWLAWFALQTMLVAAGCRYTGLLSGMVGFVAILAVGVASLTSDSVVILCGMVTSAPRMLVRRNSDSSTVPRRM